MEPLPHQIEGAKFLAARKRALLADAPRVGKTAAAIMAADYVLAHRILVVTTASGRAVWRKAFHDWSAGRDVTIYGLDKRAGDVEIVSWQALVRSNAYGHFIGRSYDVVILDECHLAKNPDAKVTKATYGDNIRPGIASRGERVWMLSGTPAPHDLGDLFPHLKFGCPERLADPFAGTFRAFRDRYCVVVMKQLSAWNRIPVVVGGRNEKELKERIGDFILRRTQTDIGILPPVFSLLPLAITDTVRREIDGDIDRRVVLAAAERNDTRLLEYHLGKLRRITGQIKGNAVVEAVQYELENGLPKIVLFAYHIDVMQVLAERLGKYGVAYLDGSSSAKDRAEAQKRFQEEPDCRVFVGQIQAAGEAIDLSAADECWFVETTFTPKDQGQAAMRVVNVNRKRTAFVKVVTLEGSVDEAVQGRLMALWGSIRKVV